MNDILQISSQQLGKPAFKTLFKDLAEAQSLLNIELFMIGAMARDVWFRLKTDRIPVRITYDLDVGAFATDISHWERLMEYLTSEKKYHPQRQKVIGLARTIKESNILVDILPFGGPENQAREVDIPKLEGPLVVKGLQEAFEYAVPILIDQAYLFKMVTVPAICMLKLISYTENPDWRQHDLADIRELCAYFFEMEPDLAYGPHIDLLEVYDEQNVQAYLPQVGSHMIGREIGQIAGKNSSLLTEIITICEGLSQQFDGEYYWSAMLDGLQDASSQDNP